MKSATSKPAVSRRNASAEAPLTMSPLASAPSLFAQEGSASTFPPSSSPPLARVPSDHEAPAAARGRTLDAEFAAVLAAAAERKAAQQRHAEFLKDKLLRTSQIRAANGQRASSPRNGTSQLGAI